MLQVDSAGIGKRETDLRLTPGGSAPRSKASKRRWADDLTWDDVPWFRSLTKMPLVLKGVQSAEDALLALKHGLDGIVVSNHGGRNMDTARPSLEALIDIMAALKSKRYDKKKFQARSLLCIDGLRTPQPSAGSHEAARPANLYACAPQGSSGAGLQVYVDGGIKRGSDVFKALAIGADAVGIGRAALFGLAAYGQPGVEKTLEILQDELFTTMQMCGAASLPEIVPGMVQGTEHVQAWSWNTGRDHLPPLAL